MSRMRIDYAGVSLVELLVTIMIVGILTAIALPNFQTWIRNARIRTTAEAITNGLQLARSEAVRRNTNVQFVLNADTSWTVGCENVVDNGVVGVDDTVGDCPAAIQSRSKGEGSANVLITATTVVFNGFGRAANATVDVTDAGGGTGLRPLRVTVASGGGVKLCDPSVGAGDPRVC